VEYISLVRDLRKRLNLSQERFASRVGTTLLTVNRWENGKTSPDPRALRAIEQLLLDSGEVAKDLYGRYFSTRHKLDTKTMETMLWQAACSIRGEKDAPKFKDYILPLVFIKRLSDVFEDEVVRLAKQYDDEDAALSVIDADHSVVRFFIPSEARWPVVSGRRKFDWPKDKKPKTLGEQLTNTVRDITKANPSLQGVIDIVDYNETRNGEREISDEALARLIETLSDPRYRLGLDDVEPDFLGRAYEYLLRKFAEGQGQSAGEFFTPQEVGWLMAYIVAPHPGEVVYDPCCGSGGLLIKCQLAMRELDKSEKTGKRPLRLFGQELTGSSFAIARMNMVIHDMEGEIVRGNSMTNPKFSEGAKLRRFDVVVTNPMWNQDNFDAAGFENDAFERFTDRGGYAPASSADWAWLQHVHASLDDVGRAAVVLDTGAASRGSGNQGENKEKSIRRWFVDRDVVEGVILLPDNLFYNTTAAGIIVMLNRKKAPSRRGKVVLINASGEFVKGRPKNEIPMTAVRKIAAAFRAGDDVERFVKVVPTAEIVKNDYNLSPSRYVDTATATEHRDVQDILDDLGKLDGEAQHLNRELKGIFEGLGYKWRAKV
jgi:type I restriction enzyme M protein